MDMEDGNSEGGLSGQQEQKTEKLNLPAVRDHIHEDSSKDEKRWDSEEDHPMEVKELSRSKWSSNLDEDETEGSKAVKGNLNALSGLIQAYGSKGKSVHWSDQGGDTGFLIGAAKKSKMLSLVIVPGAGYNLKYNPSPKEESHTSKSIGNSKKQSSFQERLRAEHESFKAVFDRKKRIGGLISARISKLKRPSKLLPCRDFWQLHSSSPHFFGIGKVDIAVPVEYNGKIEVVQFFVTQNEDSIVDIPKCVI